MLDKKMKYGGELKWTLLSKPDFYALISYENDLYETGFFNKGANTTNLEFRPFQASRFDQIENQKIELGITIMPGLNVSSSFSQQKITPAYEYVLEASEGLVNTFKILESGLHIRYNPRAEKVSYLGKRIPFIQGNPLLQISLLKSLDYAKSGFTYLKLDFSIKHIITSRSFGKTQIELAYNHVNGTAPYGKLLNGRGARGGNVETFGYFQTMGLYEFTASQYAGLFLRHNFGNVLFNTRYSKPEFVINHSMAWGTFNNSNLHTGIETSSLDEGYYESGAGLNNILRVNYLNIGFIGVGASAFYRYGPYQLPGISDNFAYRINFSFSY
jgi:hypothetical protein